MLGRAWSMPGLWNKLCVVLNGPGWSPGKPRLGDSKDLPEVSWRRTLSLMQSEELSPFTWKLFPGWKTRPALWPSYSYMVVTVRSSSLRCSGAHLRSDDGAAAEHPSSVAGFRHLLRARVPRCPQLSFWQKVSRLFIWYRNQWSRICGFRLCQPPAPTLKNWKNFGSCVCHRSDKVQATS